MNEGIRIFERKHMATVMLYLLEHGPATRMDIYNDIANNDHMPDKFAILEGHGLIVQTMRIPGRAIVLSLTEKGENVARLLQELNVTIQSIPDGSDTQ